MPSQLARAQSQVSIMYPCNPESYLVKQGTPRQLCDAEAQYAQSQVAYARQQVKNSPMAQLGISSAEPSPVSVNHSPSIYQSGFEVGLNGTPESSKPRKAKQNLSLVVDNDTVDGSDAIPNSAVSSASTKKTTGRKAPTRGGLGAGRGRGGKGGRKGRGSISETPPSATPGSGTLISPIYPSNDIFGGSVSVPGTSQSLTFQYPTSAMDLHQDAQDQRQPGEQEAQMQYQYESASNLNQQHEVQQSYQLNKHQTLQAGTQNGQLSATPSNPTAQDFLNSFHNASNAGTAQPQRPASAFPGTFDESAFDFDVSGKRYREYSGMT